MPLADLRQSQNQTGAAGHASQPRYACPRHVSRCSISSALSSFPKRTAAQCISGVEWEHFGGRMWFGLETDCVLWKQSLLHLTFSLRFLTGFSGFSGCSSDSKVCLRRSLLRSVRSEYAVQPSPWHLCTTTNARGQTATLHQYNWYTSGHLINWDNCKTKLLVVLSHCLVRYLCNKCRKAASAFLLPSLVQLSTKSVCDSVTDPQWWKYLGDLGRRKS